MSLFDNFTTNSNSFKGAKKKAYGILQDQERLRNLLSAATSKIKDLRKDSTGMQQLQHYVATFTRMIKAYRDGTYKAAPWKSLLLVTAGIIYFVSPLDLIPDFIPVFGYVDDISILVWIANSLKKDVEEFEEWESSYAESV